jgi:hypothetical protein
VAAAGGEGVTLSPAQHAEAVGHLLALRRLAAELAGVFATSSSKADREQGARGAAAMVDSIDRVLDLLGYPRAGR